LTNTDELCACASRKKNGAENVHFVHRFDECWNAELSNDLDNTESSKRSGLGRPLRPIHCDLKWAISAHVFDESDSNERVAKRQRSLFALYEAVRVKANQQPVPANHRLYTYSAMRRSSSTSVESVGCNCTRHVTPIATPCSSSGYLFECMCEQLDDCNQQITEGNRE
jgi:hypothetical protein